MRKAFAGAAALWLAQAGAALALDAPGLLAEWKASAQSAGATLTYDAEGEGVGGILVTALKLKVESPLPFILSVPKLRMESLDYGRVRLIPQSTVTILWESATLFGEGETRLLPDDMHILLSHSGNTRSYYITSDRLRIEGEMPLLTSTTGGARLQLEAIDQLNRATMLSGLRASLLHESRSGARVTFVGDVDSTKSELTIPSSPDSNPAQTKNTTYEKHRHVEAGFFLPASMRWRDLERADIWAGVQTNGIQFVQHTRGGEVRSITTDGGTGFDVFTMTAPSFSQRASLGSEGAYLHGEAHDAQVLQKLRSGAYADYKVGYVGISFAAPLMSLDAQEVALALDFEDTIISPEAWAHLDPRGVFSPLPIDLSLQVGLRLRTDLPTALAAMQTDAEMPSVEVDSITLRKLAFSGLGMDLQSDGGLAFDMSKTPPLRSGALHTELKGSQNLIAALEAKGFLEGEMLTGLRFVLSGFFKVVGEDHLTSDIKIEEGLLTLNGVKIGGIENLPFPN